MSDNTYQILEEGQEITIGCTSLDNQTESVRESVIPGGNQSSGVVKNDNKDMSSELAELNQLFQELEEMIEEKKEPPKVSPVQSKIDPQERHAIINNTLGDIQKINNGSFSTVDPLPEDEEEFNIELEEFCYLPSRTRLINHLNTCRPIDKNQEYTTISEYGNYYKIKLAISLSDIIRDAGLAHTPVMYIASGLDLEFPMLLQSRHIIMVDPRFSNSADVNQIISKVNQYDSYDPEVTQISSYHHNIKFRFNFGQDLETVNLDLFGKKYQEYRNFLPLGMIIEYNSSLNHSLAKSDLMAKLMTGGIIINNQSSPIRELHLGWLNRLSKTVDPDQIEAQNANHLGLKAIHIPYMPFSVYQKLESNQRLLNYSESVK